MSTQVTDLNLLRDQLLVRRQKLEAASAKAQTANLLLLLEEVDKALERVEVGAYGICEACHDSMGAERLLTDPLARFCLDCLKPAEQRALEQDLQLAARIQIGLLPRQDLIAGSWKTSYHYEPAGLVSGDYCDLLHYGDHLYFMVGDVSGKGVAASMLMANLHAMFRVLIPTGLPLPELVERANHIFSGSTLATQYATLIIGKADEYGNVEICNGGHVYPLHLAKNEVKVIESTGLPVGLFHDQKFATTTVRLAPGDAIVAYTDGVSEAENPDGTQYADSYLQELLRACHTLGSREIIDRCMKEVLAFRAGSPKVDDQTILALQFAPNGHVMAH